MTGMFTGCTRAIPSSPSASWTLRRAGSGSWTLPSATQTVFPCPSGLRLLWSPPWRNSGPPSGASCTPAPIPRRWRTVPLSRWAILSGCSIFSSLPLPFAFSAPYPTSTIWMRQKRCPLACTGWQTWLSTSRGTVSSPPGRMARVCGIDRAVLDLFQTSEAAAKSQKG